jgi:hypothetical protein
MFAPEKPGQAVNSSKAGYENHTFDSFARVLSQREEKCRLKKFSSATHKLVTARGYAIDQYLGFDIIATAFEYMISMAFAHCGMLTSAWAV